LELFGLFGRGSEPKEVFAVCSRALDIASIFFFKPEDGPDMRASLDRTVIARGRSWAMERFAVVPVLMVTFSTPPLVKAAFFLPVRYGALSLVAAA